MKIVNTTPHPCTFQGMDKVEYCESCGGAGMGCPFCNHGVATVSNLYTVEPCGVLINARPVEEPAGRHPSGAVLVRTRFKATAEAEAELSHLEQENPGAIIVGSIITAQAFPGRVFAMVPVPGFERVPPAEKRMQDDKFTIF